MFDYPLAVATTRDRVAVEGELWSVLAAARSDFAVSADVLSASVDGLESPISAELYADLLGVPATCRVTFHVDNKAGDGDDHLAAYPALCVAAVRLGEALDADTCLTFQLDRVVMRRRGGTLELFDWFRQWAEPEVLARLPQPYVVTAADGRL